MGDLGLWIGFNVFVLVMLAIDLGVFHREAHTVSIREAAVWTTIWIALALIFCGGLYHFEGAQMAVEFLTGYIIEKSLSVDNIFVFVLVFSYLRIPPRYQHRVLFWGILGALVMRGAFIAIGAILLREFHWIIYVFGAFLIITGLRLAFAKGHEFDPEKSKVLQLVQRFMPISRSLHQQRFFVRSSGGPGQGVRRVATPLFLALVLVETSDVIFALDSIPAVFAVTQDPFLVYTSNVFAILGLRSLYFLLAGMIERFHYLEKGLAVVLMMVGVKMLVSPVFHIPTVYSLLAIFLVLAVSVVASLVFPKEQIVPADVAEEVLPGYHVNGGASGGAERSTEDVATKRDVSPLEE